MILLISYWTRHIACKKVFRHNIRPWTQMYISTKASLQEPTTTYDSFSCLQQMKTSFFLSWNGYCKRKYKWCQQLKPLNKQFQALSLSCVSSLFACSLFLAWSWFLADSPCSTRVSSDLKMKVPKENVRQPHM